MRRSVAVWSTVLMSAAVLVGCSGDGNDLAPADGVVATVVDQSERATTGNTSAAESTGTGHPTAEAGSDPDIDLGTVIGPLTDAAPGPGTVDERKFTQPSLHDYGLDSAEIKFYEAGQNGFLQYPVGKQIKVGWRLPNTSGRVTTNGSCPVNLRIADGNGDFVSPKEPSKWTMDDCADSFSFNLDSAGDYSVLLNVAVPGYDIVTFSQPIKVV